MKKLFTIGASTIPGEFIIPRVLSEITKRLPETELIVDISDSLKVFERIKTGDIEIGVIGTRYNSDDVEYTTIIKDDRLVFIAPKGHPLAEKRDIKINDLKGKNFINRERGSGTRDNYEKAFKDAGLSMDDLNIIAEISDTEGVIQAVEGGAGISVVSELAAKDAIELGKVVILDVPLLKMTRDFYIITSKTRVLSDNAKEMMSVLKEVMK
ncbi:MAG TPA: hypothetical protein DEP99_00785 [Nitrospiraceae bacterium]|nr:hypothetical protein [Nitrospiraceae bacterium]